MNNHNSALGKGLSSLIPNKRDESKDSSQVSSMPAVSMHSDMAETKNSDKTQNIIELPIESIKANPWQPRNNFDLDKLNDLAQSIKEHGILQPIIVTKAAENTYQLIAGERRHIAASKIHLKTIPAIIRAADEQSKLELSLIENIQRQNLNPLEEAKSYKQLIDEFNLTQEDVAGRVSKSRSSIANFLRLLSLPQKVQDALKAEQISVSHAKIILSFNTEKEQLIALEKILKEKLTVAETTALGGVPVAAHDRRKADPVLKSWEEKLTARLGFPSRIKKMPVGGQIEISYTSEEDLKGLLDSLLGDG